MNDTQLNVHDFRISDARSLMWRPSSDVYEQVDVFGLATLQFSDRHSRIGNFISGEPEHSALLGNWGQQGQRGHSRPPLVSAGAAWGG